MQCYPTLSFGMSDAAQHVMIRMKDTNKLIKNVLRALPAMPFMARKKTSSVLPFVLGAIGVAIVSGIAAVMALSPRTRHLALDAAKGRYEKVRTQIGSISTRGGDAATQSANYTSGL